MNYMISYDLNKSGQDYEALFEAIKNASNGIWCKPCKSTWLIQSGCQTSTALYEALEKSLDANDFIVIAKIDGTVYGRMEKSVADYIGKHFNQ